MFEVYNKNTKTTSLTSDFEHISHTFLVLFCRHFIKKMPARECTNMWNNCSSPSEAASDVDYKNEEFRFAYRNLKKFFYF